MLSDKSNFDLLMGKDMKTIFLWAWGNYEPQEDKLMTRKRAAVLLRSWRNNARKPANNQSAFEFCRLSNGVYQAKAYGETGTMFIFRG